MLKYLSFFCLLSNLLFAQNYFIHLTESGLSNKSHLLNNKFDKISGIKNSTFSKSAEIKFQEAAPQKETYSTFNKWLVLQSAKSNEIIEDLSKNDLIDFYEEVGKFHIDFTSNDSLSSQQWYLDKINVAGAWNLTKGSPDIIIGIIDTGIDFIHPDLQQAIWVNPAEDLNHNGLLDEQDINHIDDDANGYIDDVVGWDFTDAPRFADGGDYLDEDNEPWDEFSSGHGTQAAGIIAAKDNNGIGIAGIAPDVKIMNLRAGTANGYLEEDDVGRAILYALNNGAKVINMSFGDKALSRFLREVIEYAYQQGMVFIASSGNDNSSEPHYPSSLPQVISVGASTQNDGIAGFSNYGNSLDIVAPGSEIVSTAIGGKYNSVGGTSFSAPVVSAVAGLVLSKNSETTPDQLRNILKTGADDIYYQGWDSLSAAGRVSAYKALLIPEAGLLKIDTPPLNSSIASDEIVVMGSASHPDLKSTEISYGIGKFPAQWISLADWSARQFFEDTLAVFEPEAGDTVYTIRIKMDLYNGYMDELRHTFQVDNTPPHISKINNIEMWDRMQQSRLITFETDDICTASLYIRPANSSDDFVAVVSPYETVNHRLKIDRRQFDGDFEFYIQVKNSSGLISIDDNNGVLYSFSLKKNFNLAQFSKVSWSLPAGYMLNKVTDFDHDGQKEIVLSRYNETNGFGPVEIYEFDNGHFNLRLKTAFTAIPRAAGDIDQDGKSDLLLGFGQNSFLFEAPNPDSFPSQLIWQDTSNFWAAGYTDLDCDNKYEIIGRMDKDYIILENNGENTFTETARLSNPTEGENRLGVPGIETVDLNNDGVDEIVFGDYDGDLLAYSANGNNSFYLFASGNTIHPNATELLSTDSNSIIFTATHTSQNLNYEHEFDARFWSIESFTQDNNALISKDTINIFGFADTRDFDSGLDYFEFDNTGYLFASFFPNLYLFKWTDDNWNPVWFYDKARSNSVLVYDFDNDGQDEFYFNDGENIIGFSSGISERPETPASLIAYPEDSTTVYVKWQGNSGYYNIYRGKNINHLQLYSSTGNTFFQDSVLMNTKYFYAVTSVDSSSAIKESFYSNIDSVITIAPARYVNYEFSNEKKLIIHYDKTITLNTQRPAHVYRTSDSENAASLIVVARNALLLSFAEPFIHAQNDTLILTNIFGETGVPVHINSRSVPVMFSDKSSAPYIKSSGWYSEDKLLILFSEPMDFNNAPGEFKVSPSGRTRSITVADSLYTSILLDFSSDTYVGASGEPSYVVLEGLKSMKGVELGGIKRISLYKEISSLKNIKVYPQPLKPKHDKLIFANLPGDVEITIYNMNGRPVRHLMAETYYGGINWDLKDDNGDMVTSGIYLFNIAWKNKSEQGKIVIIR